MHEITVAQASVSPDALDGVADPGLLRRGEAGRSDDQTRDKEQHLDRVAWLEGLKYAQRLIHGDSNALVVLGWVASKWGRFAMRRGLNLAGTRSIGN